MCFSKNAVFIILFIHVFQLFEVLWDKFQHYFNKKKIVEKCGKLIKTQ